MRVLGSSLSEAESIRNSQGSLRNLSGQLNLGTKYRLFFKLNEKADLMVAVVPGRKLDFDKLKSSFICIEEFDQTSTGKIVDNSGLQTWARIGRVLYKAECNKEKIEAEASAEAEAKRLGEPIDTIGLSKTLHKIEVEYFGDEETDPKTMPSKNPLIGKVEGYVVTEVLVVPMNANDAPEWSKKFVASLELSSRKISQLRSLVLDKNYCPAGSTYLEVSYDYGRGCTDKKKAGLDSTYNGVSADMSLATKFADGWEANKSMFDTMAKTAEEICARNKAISMSPTVKEVVERIKTYVAKQKLVLASIDMEDDLTKAAAQDFIDFEVAKNVPKVQSQLLALLEAQRAEKAEEKAAEGETSDAPDITKEELDKITSATTLAELADATAGIDDVISEDEGVGSTDIDNI